MFDTEQLGPEMPDNLYIIRLYVYQVHSTIQNVQILGGLELSS